MKTKWFSVAAVAVVALALGAMLASRGVSAPGEAPASSGGPHYTVVETEGHNLLVTDNRTNILYFYTIDKDAKIGSDLKLRGKIDLKQVGKEVIQPADVKLQK